MNAKQKAKKAAFRAEWFKTIDAAFEADKQAAAKPPKKPAKK